jgi:hypothetical protein
VDRYLFLGDVTLLAEYNWEDLRGYLKLKKRLSDGDPELMGDLSQIKSDTINDLVGMCRNNGGPSKEACHEYVKKWKNGNEKFLNLYKQMEPNSLNLYESFFKIRKWDRLSGVATMKTDSLFKMYIPFDETTLGSFKEFFWQSLSKAWNISGLELEPYGVKGKGDPVLRLNNQGISYVVYGSRYSMYLDRRLANSRTGDASFTVAHEFGHILGFPDCYLEFYDKDEKAMIYYNLNEHNLMCSRDGKVLPEHLAELKRVYR